jgi:hypothetical protein
MDNHDLNELAQDYHEKKTALDSIMKEEKEIRAKKEEAEERLVEAMISAQLNKIALDGFGSFTIRKSTNWNIVDQDRLVAYLKQHAPAMIKIHPVTIKGWANDLATIMPETALYSPEKWINEFGMEPYEKVGITLRKK